MIETFFVVCMLVAYIGLVWAWLTFFSEATYE